MKQLTPGSGFIIDAQFVRLFFLSNIKTHIHMRLTQISYLGHIEPFRAFAEFLVGKRFRVIDLDLVINTVAVGSFAERCEDQQSLFAQQFSEPAAVYFFPTDEACVDGNVFVLGSTNGLLELAAGVGFRTEKLVGQFTVGEEDAIQGPFAAQCVVSAALCA